MPKYTGRAVVTENAGGMTLDVYYVLEPHPPFIEGKFTVADVPEWAKPIVRAGAGHDVTVSTSGTPETLSCVTVR